MVPRLKWKLLMSLKIMRCECVPFVPCSFLYLGFHRDNFLLLYFSYLAAIYDHISYLRYTVTLPLMCLSPQTFPPSPLPLHLQKKGSAIISILQMEKTRHRKTSARSKKGVRYVIIQCKPHASSGHISRTGSHVATLLWHSI